MCLCAEPQEGRASVTDDAGEEADPSRGGAAGTPSSDAAGSSVGKTIPASLTVCCGDINHNNNHYGSHHVSHLNMTVMLISLL